MRPCVNTDTGKTVYDVVDGKQRLEAIVDFIENKIPLTAYFAEDDFTDEANLKTASEISGLTFEEIKRLNSDFPDYIKQFWTYSLNIEYLYEQKEELVASVFDRLNRNGEPLTSQELRNAKYNDSILLKTIKKLVKDVFGNDKLSRLKSVRMEDVEFISELFFVVLENKILDSSPKVLDDLYGKYKNDEDNIKRGENEFKKVIGVLQKLNLDFNANKRLCWTTHLYTVFSFAWTLVKKNISAESKADLIKKFYAEYFSKGSSYEGMLKEYKDASSSRTRSETQRKKRLFALLSYCDIDNA